MRLLIVLTPWPHPPPSSPFQLYSIHLPQAVRSQCNCSGPGPGRHLIPSSSIDQFCFCFVLTPIPSAPLWSPELHILSEMIINSPSLSLPCLNILWMIPFLNVSVCVSAPTDHCYMVCVVTLPPRLGDKSHSGCLLRFVNRPVTSAHDQSTIWTPIKKTFFWSSFLGFWFMIRNISYRKKAGNQVTAALPRNRWLNV